MAEELKDTISIKVMDKDQEVTKTIKMSVGLLNILFSKFKDQDQIYSLGLDSIMQNELMNEALDARDENGNRENPEKNWALFLNKEEGEKLLNWISGHVIDFFTSKLELQAKTIETINNVVQKINKEQVTQTKTKK